VITSLAGVTRFGPPDPCGFQGTASDEFGKADLKIFRCGLKLIPFAGKQPERYYLSALADLRALAGRRLG